MKSTWKRIEAPQDPQQFIYYMTQLAESPCLICAVQPMCKKSFLDDSACDELAKFISKYTKEIQDENKD